MPETEKMSNLATHCEHSLSKNQPVGDGSLALRKENTELRARINEMEQAWLDGQREYETLLEEKSEIIRGLHQKMQEHQEGGGRKTDDVEAGELLEMQRHLDEEREQLKHDEESLMAQMRQMEMGMSKERAELARQRNELQRFQAELNREVELASRDAGLRDRLQGLQRRQQENQNSVFEPPPTTPALATPSISHPSDQTPLPKKGSSGLIRRLFG